MERSRSKRNYYYNQDYDSQQNQARTKPRFHPPNKHHYNNNNHHRRGGLGGGRFSKPQESSPTVSTCYRILCHDIKAGSVIGKSGNIIKAIRQETGAWINVHPLIPGDEERIIEISDTRRRDPDGRAPSFSPAQEALLIIHDRILESDAGFGFGFDGSGGDDEEDYGPRAGGDGSRVATRLVVAKANVGSLLGKGGKIIEQMRIETKTQIRILPRDHNLPQCVSISEEIVQVVGDVNAVKKAVAIMASRLRESQHRDRSHFHGRLQSPDHFFPPDDDFAPQTNNMSRRSSMDGSAMGPRFASGTANFRSNAYSSHPSGYALEAEVSHMVDHAPPFSCEEIVFRILCSNDKVDRVMGERDGIIELLQGDIGVEVRITDPEPGLNERIITISSDEGPDDVLFPAQEALLHIQSKIVDLDKDNVITTRLLVPSSDVGCLEGRDGSLSEMRKLTGANLQILPRDELPLDTIGDDELLQITGEIMAAREALVAVTERLRTHLYREFFSKDMPTSSISSSGHTGSMFALEVGPPNGNPIREGYPGSDPPSSGYLNAQSPITTRLSKDAGTSRGGSVDRKEGDAHEDPPIVFNRLTAPLVTRSTLEVVIPEQAIPKLITKSGNKLAQLSELSGASISLVEGRPEQTEKIIQISGTPEQTEKAQSLLQGFILSTQGDDAPAS